MTPNTLHFTPVLPCVDCRRPTQLGLIYAKSSLTWQLLPLCEGHIKEPAAEEGAFSTIADLQQLVAHHLQIIHQIQRKKRHQSRAYLRLRRQHAPAKALRALRWRLNRSYKLQVEAMEVGR